MTAGLASKNPLMAGPAASASDLEAIARLGEARKKLKEQIARVIVGQEHIVDDLLTALFARGHCLMIGVPGLAKTLMVRTIAQAIDLEFNRIQFTPDLMPSDITGTEILEEEEGTGHRRLRFVKGPIFGNILLGDEINRTPPKTQAALLQAMQELQVTVGGRTYDLPRPFFVLATQNPIEQEGTYPLPEAQLDRFMFKILVDYPSYDEEVSIAESTTGSDLPAVQAVLDREGILAIQKIVRKVLIARSVTAYAVQLVRATRPHSSEAPEFVKKYLTWGAGPRACQALLLGGKAHALLDGRVHVSTEDIRYVARPVLRHRLATSFRAESDGVSADHIVEKLFHEVREPMAK